MQNNRSGGWLHENNFPDPWQLLPLPLHSTPRRAERETQIDQSNEKRRLTGMCDLVSGARKIGFATL